MKRQRGRGRRPGGGGHHNHGGGGGGGHQNPNRTLESNGPETKVRGPAAVIYERYLQLARDAASSGDRVLSENYLQHADHYFRLVRSMQPAAPPPQPERFDGDMDGDEEGAPENEAEAGEEGEGIAAEGGEQPDVDFPQGEQQRFDRGGDGEFRRRRGRGRNRYRSEGERGEGGEGRAEGNEGGEEREPRAEGGESRREPRAEGEGRRERRPPRNRDEDQGGPEGFSNGPKPAFLRSGD